MTATLRVAVATDRQVVRWQARCVEALAAVPGVTLERWIQTSSAGRRRRAGADAGALDPVPVPDVLCVLSTDDAATSNPTIAASSRRVDILLDLTSQGLASSMPGAAEVWRYGYGPALSRDPDRAALIEYVRGSGVTRVGLVSESTGIIIREGWLQTVSWWTGAPLGRLLLDPVDWPATSAMIRTDPAFATGTVQHRVALPARSARDTEPPDPSAGIPRSVLEVGAAARRMLGWFDVLARHPDWAIGIIAAPIERILEAGEEPDIDWLPGIPGRYAADPFGVERDGVLHVLFEEFDQRRAKGHISHVAIDRSGSVSGATPVLAPGSHVSYPFLVQHEGAVYMLPEVAEAGELVLYEATDFPYGWRPAVTLLPGVHAVDASVVEFEGRWWMFASRLDRGPNQNLFVWHAPELTGPWTPHDANPVKTDARSARSGGTPFISGGRLYRPSQDSSRSYGGRLIVNRVEVLTASAFEERRVRVIEPRKGSRYPDGLHTLSAAGGRTLVDGKVLHFVKDAARLNVLSKVAGRRSS